ncbi:hypothetical protein [Chlamydia vaughanii]|uniref:hypothetical protein n=1 Tax=Chlamydia vaughanii TaxID=3112552 RepID=UPI0032B1DD58
MSLTVNREPPQLSTESIESRYHSLTTEGSNLRLVNGYRFIIEIVAAILGSACFAVSVALAIGVIASASSVWLVPTGFALGAALLTFAVTSAFLRQSELRIDRSWRSHALRWTNFAFELKGALAAKKAEKKSVSFAPLQTPSN